MEYSLSNSLVGGSKSLNPFGLSLDLQFAADKSLTARKGPKPTFIRASAATYYGPLIEVNENILVTIGVLNGRAEWFVGDVLSDYISVFYNNTHWRIFSFISNESNIYDAAVGSEFRPDEADWSAVAFYVEATTSGEFNFIIAALNEPRFDHDTTTSLCKGLLIEESRTNIVFPSDNLTTQTRTVTATPHTLSFYGAGTVVLSGAHVATIVGTGFLPTRTTLTFTPTAGSLTLTATGTVALAQLEAGAFPTSYMPTTTGSAVRSADLCLISGSNFTGFWNQSAGTLVEEFEASPNTNTTYVSASNGTIAQNSVHLDNDTSLMRAVYYSGGLLVATLDLGSIGTVGTVNTIATAYSVNDFAASRNGGTVVTDTSGAVPASLYQMNIGTDERPQSPTSFYSNRCIKSLRYYKKRLTNSKLQTLTAYGYTFNGNSYTFSGNFYTQPA